MKKLLLITMLSFIGVMIAHPLIARKTETYGKLTIGTHYDDIKSRYSVLRFKKGSNYEMPGVTDKTIVLIEL